MNPVQAVAAILKAYRPHFADADYAPVRRWLDAGCDLEQDILPVIRDWTSRRTDIYSLGFFARHVLAAKKRRTPLASEDCPHNRARHIAYLIRVLGRCMPTDQRWLAAYERKHGTVAPVPQKGEKNL